MKPHYLIQTIGRPAKGGGKLRMTLCQDRRWREWYHIGTFGECAKLYQTEHNAIRQAGRVRFLDCEVEVVRRDWNEEAGGYKETRVWHRSAIEPKDERSPAQKLLDARSESGYYANH